MVNGIKYMTSVPGPGTTPFTPTRRIFIALSVTVTNAGQAPGVFDGASFVWVSPTGQRVSDVGTSLGGATPDEGQASTTLQPGQHATGTEYFDVPAVGGHLDYEIGTGQAPLFTIDLPLR